MPNIYKIFIGLGILVLLILGYLLFLNPSGNSKKLNLSTNSGNVVVDDFRTAALETRENITYSESNEEYSIYYDNNTKKFAITLYPDTLEKAIAYRSKAEQKFLEMLNVNQEQACKLDVSVLIPISASPQLSGTDYGLSFCPGSYGFEINDLK